jgi:predicted AlkP superfamily pyrophosphatase or phosphodiesterase
MKLLVFVIDALCSHDLEWMKDMPHFSVLFEQGSYVRSILPVHPALTYSCHTAILTGRFVDGHGILHNEALERGGKTGLPWHNMRRDIKVPTLMDYAREAGLSTCSLSWPVSGAADLDFNFPMIVPYDYYGYEPEKWLEGTATKNLMDAYFWKYGRYLKGLDRSLDLFTMAVAPDIIEDFGQPDLMLVKMCDLDSVRHTFGVYHERTHEQLRKHDQEFGVLLETVRRYGDFENTNFVIVGDHGQTDVEDVLNINRLFANEGFIELDKEGKLISFEAFGHSAGLSCFIEVANPEDTAQLERVRAFLETLKDDPNIKLRYVLDKDQAKAEYHLAGPFDFVIESDRNVSFSDRLDNSEVWVSREPGDHKIGMATHGSRPDRLETTALIVCGPGFVPGVKLDQANMVDIAPTLAEILGLSMENCDGQAIKELIRTNESKR